jgi:hypothetical protein
MSHKDSLIAASGRHRAARKAAAETEADRDAAIRRAHFEGGMSTREIAGQVGLSFQRVATVIAGDRDRPERRTLHRAMRQVLEERGGDWLSAHELARVIYERELYQRKDRGVIHPAQIRARAARYEDLFEGTTDGTNRVRLVASR